MFGFVKQKENPDRAAFRDEFETMTARLRATNDVVQRVIGSGL